jgi:hypothetical protein
MSFFGFLFTNSRFVRKQDDVEDFGENSVLYRRENRMKEKRNPLPFKRGKI